MRKVLFNIMGVAIVLGGIIAVIFVALTRDLVQTPDAATPGTSATFPVSTKGQPLPNQRANAGTNPEIAQAFYAQVSNVPEMTLGGTIIVDTYAIQNWTDVAGGGGEGLLHYTEKEGWKVMPVPSGGAWSLADLLSFGIPEESAKGLIAGRDW